MVKFETITGRAITLDFAPNTTFGEIKNQIAEHFNCDVPKVHLLFDGSDLQNSSKLSTINLENGKRFIVIYIEPSGEVPDVEEMINMLIDFNPNRNTCLEALQNNNYNIEQASDYLLNLIENEQKPPPSTNNNNKPNINGNSVTSKQTDGKVVKPEPNPFVYTPSQKTNSNPYNLTDDEVKLVQQVKPKEMDDIFAYELFTQCNKNIDTFRDFLQ